jgi:hypothetical protein
VVAEVRDRLSVSKLEAQRFNPKKVNEVEIREQYQIRISKSFAAFGNLDDSRDSSRALENIIGSIKILGECR